VKFVSLKGGETRHDKFLGNVKAQLVAFATRFLAVRLKNQVVAPPRLKSQSLVGLLNAYSPDHTNVLQLININININITTRHQIIKLHHFPFIGVCPIRCL